MCFFCALPFGIVGISPACLGSDCGDTTTRAIVCHAWTSRILFLTMYGLTEAKIVWFCRSAWVLAQQLHVVDVRLTGCASRCTGPVQQNNTQAAETFEEFICIFPALQSPTVGRPDSSCRVPIKAPHFVVCLVDWLASFS